MKGKVWSEHKHKLVYPVVAEIKHDEIRCHVIVQHSPATSQTNVAFISFSGKPLANLDQWAEDFIQLSKATGWKEFDCGFLANGNFNDSYRWVRSTKNFPPELEGKPCEFLLFDLPECGDPYEQRDRERHAVILTAHALNFRNIDAPRGTVCANEAAVYAAFLASRAAGHEGLMVKSLTHTYQRGKRIDGWLKMKPENDCDGTITALHRGVSIHGEPLDRVTSIDIAVEDGSKATPHGIPHELGRDMLANPQKYIGQWAEFFYMERDRQGGYRHPTFHRIREAKVCFPRPTPRVSQAHAQQAQQWCEQRNQQEAR